MGRLVWAINAAGREKVPWKDGNDGKGGKDGKVTGIGRKGGKDLVSAG
jgi:hypothetical protein